MDGEIMEEKRKEILAYAEEALKGIIIERDDDFVEIHHQLFNEGYYIIGRYKAIQWLGSDVFECIQAIKDYEQSHFGTVHTDFDDPEKVVNMYVYIIGEEVLQEILS
mgnify:CR=1 FL=1